MSPPTCVEVVLPGSSASVPQARRVVRGALVDWHLEDLLDDALLVVTELATNAVLHARSEVRLRVLLEPPHGVRLEVADDSPQQPAPRHYSEGASTGRGLRIIEDLAQDWGVQADADGKVVWARLSAEQSGADSEPQSLIARPSHRGSGRPRPVAPRGLLDCAA